MNATATRFLDEMAHASAQRLALARSLVAPQAVIAAAHAAPAAARLAPGTQGFDLIMELKLASPALGALAPAALDLEAQVRSYARAGAAIVSVLTEPTRFAGELAHLSRAAAALAPHGVPAMRKDFLVDPYQVYEARVHGAGGVLLIVRMLDEAMLAAMLRVAAHLEMFVLLETFDAGDIARARRAATGWTGPPHALLVGVNSRDLQTLAVVPGRLDELVRLLPDTHPRVAESGLAAPADAGRLAAAGYDYALVGTALMAAADPVVTGQLMIEAGRAGAARRVAAP